MKQCGEYIIPDSSSLGGNSYSVGRDYSVKVGVVREPVFIPGSNETRYIVELWDRGRLRPVTCTRLTRFGGLYNYEEVSHRGFDPGKDNVSYGNFSVCSGDNVLVACVNGESAEGIILGGIKHFGRSETLPGDGSIAYASEFNGVEKIINKLGEYRVTFKGLPTNIDELKKAPDGKSYPNPIYDTAVGYSFYQFDKSGSYFVTDNAKDGQQYIQIDKSNGKLIIGSGKTTLTIDKKEQSYTIVNKKVTFNTSDEFNLNTKKTTIKSTNLTEIESKDIKITGKLKQTGNVEVAGNIKQTGNTEVAGTFKTSGKTDLAGGSYPLVYDIQLIIGTGNLGAPVISNAILLKTTMTKAT